MHIYKVRELIEENKKNNIKNLIHVIRGQQVMLDNDLANLYGYEVKQLNQQVKRNLKRFPKDFMFQLTSIEIIYLRSQKATTNINSKSRSNPYVFTEQGIYVLATVLKGDIAIEQSICIFKKVSKKLFMIAI